MPGYELKKTGKIPLFSVAITLYVLKITFGEIVNV
jgi:hypothetical protein